MAPPPAKRRRGAAGADASGRRGRKSSRPVGVTGDGALQFIEEEHEGMDDASIREHEMVTKVKNVRKVELGRHRMETWYFSPYPKEIFNGAAFVECLYLCEFTFAWFTSRETLRRHQKKCVRRHPPGDEIYRHDKSDARSGGASISMFEVDGQKATEYCQNLCYFAKLFLDHKTLYYDVQPFLFYVMCERTEYGYHPVGFYSKEKYSETGFNLACILAFPCYQRRGFGRFLIQFSYELSKKEGRVGSPEKPLSDLGLLSYRSFWAYELCTLLQRLVDRNEKKKAELAASADPRSSEEGRSKGKKGKPKKASRKSGKRGKGRRDDDGPEVSISVMDIAKITSIKVDDIVSTLQWLGLVRYVYGKGDHIICADPEIMAPYVNKRLRGPQVDPAKLHWMPYDMEMRKDKWSIKQQEILTLDEEENARRY
jgi:histone acetyltransferase MYST1